MHERSTREAVRRSRLLRPQSGSPSITRRRLIDRLDTGSRGPVTIVRAPAGYGKSTLLRDWDAEQEAPSAWLQMEEGDNDLVQFATSIVAAIGILHPDFGSQTVSLLTLYDIPGPRFLGATLADELLGIPGDVILIIDDFHLISSSSVHELMEEVLRFPQPGFHLVLGTRSEPPIGLPRLRGHGLLQEITPDEMRFTIDEIEALMTVAAPHAVTPEQVEALEVTSEGWAAVLHLAAINLRRQAEVNPAWLQQGSAAETLRYLALQEIDRLTPDDRQFLLRIGQLERINAELADLLTFDLNLAMTGAEKLADVQARGLFLFPIPGNDGWFRFHQVFRSMLLGLATELDTAEIETLHLKAAHWFNEHGRVEPAIGHALALKQPDLAVSFVLEHAQLALVQDRRLAILRWLARLPENVLESNADLLLIRACIYQPVGRYDLLIESVRRAEELLAIAEPGPDQDRQRAELMYVRPMVVSIPYVSPEAIQTSHRAIAALLNTDRASEAFAILSHALVLYNQDAAAASAFIARLIFQNSDRNQPFQVMRTIWARTAETLIADHEGDLQRTGDLAHAMVALAISVNAERIASHGDYFAGAYHLQVNELDDAEKHLQRAIHNPLVGIIFRTNVGMALARCYMARGDFEGAAVLLDAEMDRLLEEEALQLLPMLRISRARLALCLGAYGEALTLLNRLPPDFTDSPAKSSDYAGVLRANAAIGAGTSADLERAEAYLNACDEVLGHSWHFGLATLTRVTRSLLAFERGDLVNALSLAQHAILDADGRGYRRLLLDLGPKMDRFLLWVARESPPGAIPTHVVSLIQHSGIRDSGTPTALKVNQPIQAHLPDADLVDVLTNRELDVLLLLQRRLANKEIADELSISPLTVKSHTRNLYRKLEVSNRRQAIARAIALHLITPG